MSRIVVFLATACVLIGATLSSAADLDDQLDKRLRGSWATLEVEVYSSCSSTYSDNKVGAAGVASKADRRFSAGELVKIDKIKVKRARVDLLTSLKEPILVTTKDGPFELYHERDCKAQLIFEVSRDVIKTRDVDAVLAVISSALTTHSTIDAAKESDGWNGRQRDPFPPDYDQTLVHYEIWKAEQINAAVAAAIEKATIEAAEAAEDIERDADYLDGFAAGAEEQQSLDIDDCDRLIDASFSTYKERPASDHSAKWKRGHEDGQSLVYHVHVLRELRRCFVPVPQTPHP